MTSRLQRFRNSGINLTQAVKFVVYVLLLINFAFYIIEDWQIAQFTRANGGTFLQWTSAFATPIDELAWFILLFLFELETYVLDDATLTRRRLILMHGARYACYVFLAHTVYAYSADIVKLRNVEAVENISSLCQMEGGESSFTSNLNYSEITIENCEELSFASEFIYLDPPDYLIVTDAEGFVIETELRIVDLAEAITWLLILFSIEAAVMLQERSIGISPSSGFLSSLGSVASLKLLNRAKVILYCLLWVAIAYWLFRGHYVWAWDEFVWIAGFVLIENNISGWREETTELDSLSQAIKENNAL
ncbi:MAG: hypothetical protein P8N11_03015 [Gammaproteobacteria bacterium]|nr:hypothetical protein [Gammaproteobacteria bacterium]